MTSVADSTYYNEKYFLAVTISLLEYIETYYLEIT
jgi:hypothetical protein